MFCPNCASEYRAGILRCASCDVALVTKLEERRSISPDDETVAVGFGPPEQSAITIDGRALDRTRVFALERAMEIQRVLETRGISTLLSELPLDLGDHRRYFEVHVRADDEKAAQEHLMGVWQAQLARETGTSVSKTTSIEDCPACGASVPLSSEECPDCGLFVGAGEEREQDGADAPTSV